MVTNNINPGGANMSLAKNLFEVMKFTKHEMKCAYERKERDTIEREYHDFRVYLRFLIIRSGIHADKRELFDQVKKEMENYRDMLVKGDSKRWKNQ